MKPDQPNSVFDFKSYRDYLNHWILQNPNGGRGVKSKLASAAQCQMSYLSRVLMNRGDLSLEQADLISRYIGHTDQEAEYFLLLVQFERTNSATLRSRFRRRMKEIEEKRSAIGERLAITETLAAADQAVYYKAWYHAALHMLVSISEYQSKQSLVNRLNLPANVITDALEFLTSTGLVKIDRMGRYSIGKTRLHLAAETRLVSQHHTNWRLKAIRSLDNVRPDDLHYSVLIGVSRADAEKLKMLLLEQITEFMKIAHASDQEDVYSFNLDLFSV